MLALPTIEASARVPLPGALHFESDAKFCALIWELWTKDCAYPPEEREVWGAVAAAGGRIPITLGFARGWLGGRWLACL